MYRCVIFLLLLLIKRSEESRCGTRWYKIFENDPQGETLYGQIDDLRDSIVHGAEIRVSVGHYITTVQNAGVIDGNVCAQALFHISKSSFDKFQDNAYWWFVNLCTTGHWQMTRYNVGEHVSRGSNEDRRAIQWFIRERCDQAPILDISKNGHINSGSVQAITEATKNGEDIRIVSGGSYAFPIDNLSYDVTESKVGAMAIWHVSQITRAVGGTFIRSFQGNDYWWFTISSTDGSRQMSRWNIGEHVFRGANADTISSQWFSNPCWKMIYQHDEAGHQTHGSLSNLIDAVSAGHRVKVYYKRSSFEADEVRFRNGHLCLSILNDLSRASVDSFQSSLNWVWRQICTTGTVRTVRYKVGSNMYVNGTSSESENITWFVDTREWKKVLITAENGSVSAGSKAVLIHALRNGAELRYRTSGSLVQQADNVAIEGEDVGAMHVRSVSVSLSGLHEVEFKTNPYWWFTITSTRGNRDMSRWTVGSHQTRGHNSDSVSVEWFVSE